MGLSVQVGILAFLQANVPDGAAWFRQSFNAVNDLLRQHHLPEHSEPETLPKLENRCSLHGFQYSMLHILRRAYARRIADPNWIATPVPIGQKPTDDPVLRTQYRRAESHLLTHSDAEGFYLPVDFNKVLFDDSNRIPGRMVGSSYRLIEELVVVAPALEIMMDGQSLPDAEAESVNALLNAQARLNAQTGLFEEKIVWLSLYEAARLSIEHRTAIVFG